MLHLLFPFFPQCILLTTGSVLTTEDAEMNRMPFKSPNPHMKGPEHRTGCRDEAGLVLRPQSLEQRHEWKIGWWEGGREGRREEGGQNPIPGEWMVQEEWAGERESQESKSFEMGDPGVASGGWSRP